MFPIDVPALRERREDLPALVETIAAQLARTGRGEVRFTPEALQALAGYDWPGNVRELEHAIHRAVVLARATQAGDEVVLEPQHFQFAVAAPMLPTETAAAAPATGNIN
ncbi:nitric oxide reductase transcription regulator, partial [Mycobacterium tuberculosis]|nr:nitric oxide reductase transcription regulator [Mycobacterium tuberculosis]